MVQSRDPQPTAPSAAGCDWVSSNLNPPLGSQMVEAFDVRQGSGDGFLGPLQVAADLLELENI